MKQVIVMLLVIMALWAVISNTAMYFVEDSLVIDEQIEVVTTEAGVCYMTYQGDSIVYIEIYDIDGNELLRKWYSVDEYRFL
jgi:hypothetical protein